MTKEKGIEVKSSLQLQLELEVAESRLAFDKAKHQLEENLHRLQTYHTGAEIVELQNAMKERGRSDEKPRWVYSGSIPLSGEKEADDFPMFYSVGSSPLADFYAMIDKDEYGRCVVKFKGEPATAAVTFKDLDKAKRHVEFTYGQSSRKAKQLEDLSSFRERNEQLRELRQEMEADVKELHSIDNEKRRWLEKNYGQDRSPK